MRHLLSVLIVLVCVAASASAAPVVADAGLRVLATGDEYQREMDAAKAAGVPWVSLPAGWTGLQPTAETVPGPDGAGGAAWRQLDARLRYAKSIGLRTFVQFTGAPVWATDGRPQNSKGNVPPRPDALPAYAAFFEAVARGLGPSIDAYSPWNEVNQPDFWDPIDPVLFSRLQQAVYPAIKRGDPTGIVVSGTVYSKDGTFEFLRDAYAAGMRGSMDVLGWMLFPSVEPESPPRAGRGVPQRNLSSILDLQALLGQVDPGRRIWVVEYSYSTCRPAPNRALCVSEAQQADYLTRAFTYMRRYLDVERLFWFSARDKEVRDIIEANYGLLRFDFSPKPAYGALRALAVETAGEPGPGAGPGTTGAPAVPAIPASAVKAPDPAAFRAGGDVVVLGKPRLQLRRGVFTLQMTVTVRGGATRLAIQGYRGKRWRPVTRVTLTRSSRIRVRFRDRGYLGIRVRASRPGGTAWVASRVIRVPGVPLSKAPRANDFSLTAKQLAINQRIGQAAVRRLNAVRAQMEGTTAPSADSAKRRGTVTLSARQLRINQRIYQAAVRRAAALEARLAGRPAPAGAAKAPGTVRLSVRQLRINQRIAQAAVRRANALVARVA